ncbi:MAG: hypothetical protein AAGC97_16820 [Planctomycetota bacterium]
MDDHCAPGSPVLEIASIKRRTDRWVRWLAWIALVVPGFSFRSSASAGVIRFDFVGTVAALDNNAAAGSTLFGVPVGLGDSLEGSFHIDMAVAPYATGTGAISGDLAGYRYDAADGFEIQLNTGVFQSEGIVNAFVADDWVFSPTIPASDFFGLDDGASGTFDSGSGSQILVNGASASGYMSVILEDRDADQFGSSALPIALDRSLFERAEGQITGTELSDTGELLTYVTVFTIDAMTATAVPEPSGGTAWVMLIGVACLARRWR